MIYAYSQLTTLIILQSLLLCTLLSYWNFTYTICIGCYFLCQCVLLRRGTTGVRRNVH